MIYNLLIGSLMLIACITIECIVVALLLRFFPFLQRSAALSLTVSRAVWLLSSGVLILFAGNLLQIGAWAALFVGLGEFDDFATGFYHSMVNFTGLGYGDLVMSTKHRLLGALEAANGVLMLGLTTGVLVAFVRALTGHVSASRQRDHAR